MKKIKVTISQTLSSTQRVTVSDDFDENDKELLKDKVIEQIILPSDAMEIEGFYQWIEDDFCVI